jgi:hypothetical protein
MTPDLLHLMRLIEFTRSDDVPVLIRPIWVIGCVEVQEHGSSCTRISTLGTEDYIDVKGTLKETQNRLDGDLI